MTFNLSGRNKQRERANSETSIQKSTSDTNTMRSHHLLQVDEELSMARSTYDLKIIEMLIKSANTDEKKVLDALYFWTKVKSIFFWMPCFGRVIRNVVIASSIPCKPELARCCSSMLVLFLSQRVSVD